MLKLPKLPPGLNTPQKPPAELAAAQPSQKDADAEKTRAAFQKFVAGTFYKQMLKSLRKTQNKPAYFHGGQAEEIFRGQMDQEVAEQLAASRGGSMSESLFQAFASQLKIRTQKIQQASQPNPIKVADTAKG